MSNVTVHNVVVLDNPTKATNPFQFEISFECIQELKEDLEWKLIYVGSSEDEEYDQVLDSVLVGPIPVGMNKFVFQADPPDWSKIPPNQVVNITVALLTCSYRNREFIRVGYYVNNEYDTEEMRQNPPTTPDVTRVVRNILAEKPRVTRFQIPWDEEEEAEYTNSHDANTNTVGSAGQSMLSELHANSNSGGVAMEMA